MPLSSVIGQNQPIQIIKKSLGNRTLSHSYLFYGPEGVGKKRAAIELAKALNCKDLGPEDSCGACNSCRKIEERTHPDFFLLQPEKKTPTSREAAIKIDDIRELQKKLIYLPYEGETKVAIIDGAEFMNPQAANTLLKTLEEPPKSTLLILIAANPYQLLPTLVSRCQGIRFAALSGPVVLSLLKQQVEPGEVDPRELELRAMRAMGSLHRALSLDENILEASKHRQELLDMIGALTLEHMDAVFQWSKAWARHTAAIPPMLDELQNLLRDLAFLKVRSQNENGIINMDLIDNMKPIAVKKSLSALVSMFESVRA